MNRAERMRLPWALLLGLLSSGCGPSSQEIGASVLTAAPVVLVTSAALLWMLWKPLDGTSTDYPWYVLIRATLFSLIGPVIGVPVLFRTGDAEVDVAEADVLDRSIVEQEEERRKRQDRVDAQEGAFDRARRLR